MPDVAGKGPLGVRGSVQGNWGALARDGKVESVSRGQQGNLKKTGGRQFGLGNSGDWNLLQGNNEVGQQGPEEGVYLGGVLPDLAPHKEVAGRLPQSQGRQEQKQATKE